MTDLDRLQHDLTDAQSLLAAALRTEALYATYSNTSKRVLKVRKECAEDVHKYQLLVTRIETSIAEEQAVQQEELDHTAQLAEQHGLVKYAEDSYTCPELYMTVEQAFMPDGRWIVWSIDNETLAQGTFVECMGYITTKRNN